MNNNVHVLCEQGKLFGREILSHDMHEKLISIVDSQTKSILLPRDNVGMTILLNLVQRYVEHHSETQGSSHWPYKNIIEVATCSFHHDLE